MRFVIIFIIVLCMYVETTHPLDLIHPYSEVLPRGIVDPFLHFRFVHLGIPF